ELPALSTADAPQRVVGIRGNSARGDALVATYLLDARAASRSAALRGVIRKRSYSAGTGVERVRPCHGAVLCGEPGRVHALDRGRETARVERVVPVWRCVDLCVDWADGARLCRPLGLAQ